LQESLRVIRERESYDEGRVFAESDRLHKKFSHVFESPNTRFCEQCLADETRRSIEGASALDYGCGTGVSSLRLLSEGARHVVGIDISPKNIAEASERIATVAAAANRAEFRVMDAHQLLFPDGIFDVVVGRSILHHLEFQKAVNEVVRVLRKGGAAIFVEPLWGNPAAKLFRALTPNAHTPDEMPLSRDQIEWADSVFGTSRHFFCGFASTALGLLTSQVFRSADNAVLHLADSVDRVVMRTRFRYWMRCVYLFWRKADEPTHMHPDER
jgi:ubiquinone/menaquinone biosynthesis C-methylase UbiE